MVNSLLSGKSYCRFYISLLFAVFFSLISSCKGTSNEQPAEILDSATPDTLKYAKGFKVYHLKDCTLLQVMDINNNTVLGCYCLMKDTTAKVQGLPANAVKIKVPVCRIVPTSATHYEPITLLGRLNTIVGVCFPERIYNEALREMVSKGKVCTLGDDSNINQERLVACHPDVVITSAYASNQLPSLLPKLGLKQVMVQEWQEQNLLGRAEWIKFFGLLYGEETQADSIFNAVETEYLRLKSISKKESSHPEVFSGTNYQGIWYVPGGESYMAQLYTDAGAKYYYKGVDQSVGSLSLNLETVVTNFGHAQFWFGAQGKTLSDIVSSDNTLMSMDAIKNHKVYAFDNRTTPTGGDDFWEGSISHPDILLADIVAVLHPQLLPDHKFFYVRKLN